MRNFSESRIKHLTSNFRHLKSRNGFTLLEILLSVAVIALIASMSAPLYRSFQTRNNVDNASNTVVHALRRAQSLSKAMDSDSAWGVYIENNAVTVFKGNSYPSRDSAYDEINNLPSGISSSGIQELYFSKFEGEASTTGNINLTSNNNESRTITINTKGTVNY